MKRSIFAMLTVLACSASAVGVSASPALAATDPTGTFSYVSTPGEFIGKGMTESFTTPGILIGAASFGPSSVDINVETSDFTRSFSLHFGAPTTAALTTGTYTGAGRFDSDTAPAISVTGNSSSCNSEGSFTVHDLSVGSNGYVNHLHISFVQDCLLDFAPGTLSGDVTYAAPPPSAPPLGLQAIITKTGPLEVADFGLGIRVEGKFRCSRTGPGLFVSGSIHFEQGTNSSGFGGIGGPCTTGWTSFTTFANPSALFGLTGKANAVLDLLASDTIYPIGATAHYEKQVPLVELLKRP
jgi:hypothetical protein